MNYWKKSAFEVMDYLKTSHKEGLTDAGVKQSREKFGENVISEEKKKSVLRVFLEQFADTLVIILIIAAIISLFTGNAESSAVILAVIVMNAILGTVQHVKAEKSLASLKAMSAPNARVLRNGNLTEIPAKDIVVGDILSVEAGNIAAADCRLIEAAALLVNESALTGESVNVVKNTEIIAKEELALGDRLNMLYSGSTISGGRGVGVVTAVGMNTELGKIASLMQNAQKKKTPLQVSLNKFSKILSIVIMVICAVVFLLTLFVNGQPVEDALMFAIALAVAAIPEALSSIITISLAIGTRKMSKQRAIIKDLKAVESLGCVSVICSDKTGTLTQNKMTVRATDSASSAASEMLEDAMALCNDAEKNEIAWLGDPTETALSEWLGEEKYLKIRSKYPRVDEIPFDSDRKLMSTVHCRDNDRIMYTKGAIDVLLSRLKYIMSDDGVRPITNDDVNIIKQKNYNFSENGMRVLAFAVKFINGNDAVTVDDEYDYTYLGMVAQTDPPREESKNAVAECISAGIKPVMITGDHKLTARAIAKEIGIYNDNDLCLDGNELDAMSDEELSQKLEQTSVYARVSPVHKIRIVELWQKKGKIVAMTGDGVNDAPALKKADVGVAMGITGTEVSKDASDMILADDNFATIVKSVANGRSIYNNIKNAVKFLLAGNAAAIIVVLLTTLLNLPLPFSPVHLLFINLLTDSLPAIALCMEPIQPGIMKDKPRSANESILNFESIKYIVIHSALISVCVMVAFFIGNTTSAALASTMAFATLCLARLFEGFNNRGKYSLFKLGIMSNKYSLAAFLCGALFLFAVLAIPALHGFMDIASSITLTNLVQTALLAFVPFALVQLFRAGKELVKK